MWFNNNFNFINLRFGQFNKSPFTKFYAHGSVFPFPTYTLWVEDTTLEQMVTEDHAEDYVFES